MRRYRLFLFTLVFAVLLPACGSNDSMPPPPPAPPTKPGSSDLTVSGKAFYEDKGYDETGFTGQMTLLPIRHAVIELISTDTKLPIASGITGEDGAYEFKSINNSSRNGGVYVQVVAENVGTSTSPAKVFKSEANQSLIVARSPIDLDDSVSNLFSPVNITAPADGNGVGGAFNILDLFLKGGAFIKKAGFCPNNLLTTECIAPRVTVFWEPKGTALGGGSSYNSNPHRIYIHGGGAQQTDTDEYDDTVIVHEYGHFVATEFSNDNSPGGSHFLTDNTQDIRLSWSEGWATFFGSAVLGSPLYVDTMASGNGFSFNIDSPKSAQIYTTNEVSVSSVLWRTMNQISPTTNTPIGFFPIWKAFTEMTTTNLTIEQFAELFMSQNAPEKAVFQSVLQERKIEHFPDSKETDGEIPLVVGGGQHHTLYREGVGGPFNDEDAITFSVTSGITYTIKTENLTNGADTFLTLDTPSMSNDNANGASYSSTCDTCPKNDTTMLASQITFMATTGGTQTVKVKRSPAAPPSAGRAGSYDIRLTSP
ncbi:MAG: hypothetical protein AAB300_01980 [Nitrospirota bacterium]